MACPTRIWRGGSLTTPNVAKETLAQVFPCEFCEISKNNFFTEHLWTTASVNLKFCNFYIGMV